jgi:hypothetical protein
LRAQSPNIFVTPSKASAAVTSPTMARIALLGTKYFAWNATRSLRVMAAIDSGVPV